MGVNHHEVLGLRSVLLQSRPVVVYQAVQVDAAGGQVVDRHVQHVVRVPYLRPVAIGMSLLGKNLQVLFIGPLEGEILEAGPLRVLGLAGDPHPVHERGLQGPCCQENYLVRCRCPVLLKR